MLMWRPAEKEFGNFSVLSAMGFARTVWTRNSELEISWTYNGLCKPPAWQKWLRPLHHTAPFKLTPVACVLNATTSCNLHTTSAQLHHGNRQKQFVIMHPTSIVLQGVEVVFENKDGTLFHLNNPNRPANLASVEMDRLRIATGETRMSLSFFSSGAKHPLKVIKWVRTHTLSRGTCPDPRHLQQYILLVVIDYKYFLPLHFNQYLKCTAATAFRFNYLEWNHSLCFGICEFSFKWKFGNLWKLLRPSRVTTLNRVNFCIWWNANTDPMLKIRSVLQRPEFWGDGLPCHHPSNVALQAHPDRHLKSPWDTVSTLSLHNYNNSPNIKCESTRNVATFRMKDNLYNFTSLTVESVWFVCRTIGEDAVLMTLKELFHRNGLTVMLVRLCSHTFTSGAKKVPDSR